MVVFLARLAELVVTILVISWSSNFPSTFLPNNSSSTTPQLDHLYSVLHPLLMVLGFILLTGEAIMAHRWLGKWSRGSRKLVHLGLQGLAFGFGLVGIWAKFRSERGVVANFYSLHSWMGLLCLSLFASQWVVGFLNFWHHGENRKSRNVVLPWHVFLGLYTYCLAVATAETGLLEKLILLQKIRASTRSPESMVVNGLGLGLVALAGFVIFATISPKHKIQIGVNGGKNTNGYKNGSKFVMLENSHNGKCKSGDIAQNR